MKDIVREEELVLNSMATVNNLSFYSSPGTAIEDNEVETSRCKSLFYPTLYTGRIHLQKMLPLLAFFIISCYLKRGA